MGSDRRGSLRRLTCDGLPRRWSPRHGKAPWRFVVARWSAQIVPTLNAQSPVGDHTPCFPAGLATRIPIQPSNRSSRV